MIGLHIARELIEERRDVVIIEAEPDAARRASDELDCIVINEDGSKPETLRKAGAGDASWFLALTGSDEVNIVACGLVSAESQAVRTLARIENPFYSTLSDVQRQAFGLDVIINPAAETAEAIARIVDEGFAEDVIPLHEGRLQLRLVAASSMPAYVGKALKDARPRLPSERGGTRDGANRGGNGGADFLVVGIIRDKAMIVPSGDTEIEANDFLYLLGPPATLDAGLGAVAGIRSAAKRILVVGATKIAERLVARFLEDAKPGLVGRLLGRRRLVTMIDSSEADCKRVARAHQGVEVIQADSAEEGILEGAGIARADLVVCATESQAFNVLTAQLGKFLGARKCLALTTNDRYMALGPALDIDALVSVKDVVAASVLEIVRRANIRTIHGFYEDDVELVELRVEPGSGVSGLSLKEIGLPKGVLVAFVMQGESMLVPSGSTVLEGGSVIGLVSRKKSIAGLELVFGGPGGD